jgi:SOS response regulatory protein OraA/RecX
MNTDEFATAMGRQAADTLERIAADMQQQGASDAEIATTLETLAEEWQAALVEGLAAFVAELEGADAPHRR